MSQVRFQDFEQVIDLAIANKIGHDAILILVGRLSYALEIGELTFSEMQVLEEKLGGRRQWQEAYELALSGETGDSSEFMGGATSQTEDSWMKDAGMLENEPLFDQVLEEIAAHRRELDVDRPELR
jgi:hypothetical protein